MHENGKYHDLKGVPIYCGDLLRTFHFIGPRRKRYYLYHGVIYNTKEDCLEMVPVSELATGKSGGGRFWLRGHLNSSGMIAAEVISGYGPNGTPYEDRPKLKKPKETQ
jgi:hypothetical protein